jgi:hypothetical protein
MVNNFRVGKSSELLLRGQYPIVVIVITTFSYCSLAVAV